MNYANTLRGQHDFAGSKPLPAWFLFYRYPLLNQQKYMQLVGVADTCTYFLVIQKHSKKIERQHNKTKPTITAPTTCATQHRKPESLQCSLKQPKPSTPIRLFHIKTPECKLKKKNIFLLAPSSSPRPPLSLVTSYLIPHSRPSDGCTFIDRWDNKWGSRAILAIAGP